MFLQKLAIHSNPTQKTCNDQPSRVSSFNSPVQQSHWHEDSQLSLSSKLKGQKNDSRRLSTKLPANLDQTQLEKKCLRRNRDDFYFGLTQENMDIWARKARNRPSFKEIAEGSLCGNSPNRGVATPSAQSWMKGPEGRQTAVSQKFRNFQSSVYKNKWSMGDFEVANEADKGSQSKNGSHPSLQMILENVSDYILEGLQSGPSSYGQGDEKERILQRRYLLERVFEGPESESKDNRDYKDNKDKTSIGQFRLKDISKQASILQNEQSEEQKDDVTVLKRIEEHGCSSAKTRKIRDGSQEGSQAGCLGRDQEHEGGPWQFGGAEEASNENAYPLLLSPTQTQPDDRTLEGLPLPYSSLHMENALPEPVIRRYESEMALHKGAKEQVNFVQGYMKSLDCLFYSVNEYLFLVSPTSTRLVSEMRLSSVVVAITETQIPVHKIARGCRAGDGWVGAICHPWMLELYRLPGPSADGNRNKMSPLHIQIEINHSRLTHPILNLCDHHIFQLLYIDHQNYLRRIPDLASALAPGKGKPWLDGGRHQAAEGQHCGPNTVIKLSQTQKIGLVQREQSQDQDSEYRKERVSHYPLLEKIHAGINGSWLFRMGCLLYQRVGQLQGKGPQMGGLGGRAFKQCRHVKKEGKYELMFCVQEQEESQNTVLVVIDLVAACYCQIGARELLHHHRQDLIGVPKDLSTCMADKRKMIRIVGLVVHPCSDRVQLDLFLNTRHALTLSICPCRPNSTQIIRIRDYITAFEDSTTIKEYRQGGQNQESRLALAANNQHLVAGHYLFRLRPRQTQEDYLHQWGDGSHWVVHACEAGYTNLIIFRQLDYLFNVLNAACQTGLGNSHRGRQKILSLLRQGIAKGKGQDKAAIPDQEQQLLHTFDLLISFLTNTTGQYLAFENNSQEATTHLLLTPHEEMPESVLCLCQELIQHLTEPQHREESQTKESQTKESQTKESQTREGQKKEGQKKEGQIREEEMQNLCPQLIYGLANRLIEMLAPLWQSEIRDDEDLLNQIDMFEEVANQVLHHSYSSEKNKQQGIEGLPELLLSPAPAPASTPIESHENPSFLKEDPDQQQSRRMAKTNPQAESRKSPRGGVCDKIRILQQIKQMVILSQLSILPEASLSQLYADVILYTGEARPADAIIFNYYTAEYTPNLLAHLINVIPLAFTPSLIASMELYTCICPIPTHKNERSSKKGRRRGYSNQQEREREGGLQSLMEKGVYKEEKWAGNKIRIMEILRKQLGGRKSCKRGLFDQIPSYLMEYLQQDKDITPSDLEYFEKQCSGKASDILSPHISKHNKGRLRKSAFL